MFLQIIIIFAILATHVLYFLQFNNPVDTGHKLNILKTFRRRLGSLLNILCAFNLHPVSTRIFLGGQLSGYDKMEGSKMKYSWKEKYHELPFRSHLRFLEVYFEAWCSKECYFIFPFTVLVFFLLFIKIFVLLLSFLFLMEYRISATEY